MRDRRRAASEPAGASSASQKPMPGTAVLLVVVLVLFGSSVGLLALPDDGNLYKVLPIQALLGSAVFISLICLVVLVFARLGLYNRSAALGLPEGSVRALLALILLIIFIIFANVIFGQLSSKTMSQSVAFSGLTEEQVRALGGPVENQRPVAPVAGQPQRWEGTYRVTTPPSEDAANLGHQVVTGMLTLVAAISAFYFGSASVTTGAAAIRRSTQPAVGGGSLQVLRPSQPVMLASKNGGGFNDLEIELGGSALDAGGVQAAILSNDPEGKIRRGSTDAVFVYSPSPHPADPVILRFTSATDSTTTVDLSISVPDRETLIAEGANRVPPEHKASGSETDDTLMA
jgi:hypothetical protein